jgi:hypothetical protein
MKKTTAIRIVLAAAMLVPAAAATAQAPAAVKPIATTTTNWGEGVSIDLMSVERKGSILTVKWQVDAGPKAARVQFGLSERRRPSFLARTRGGYSSIHLPGERSDAVGSSGAAFDAILPAQDQGRVSVDWKTPPSGGPCAGGSRAASGPRRHC